MCIYAKPVADTVQTGWKGLGNGVGDRSGLGLVDARLAAATEPPCINPSLDERRCFCDLRSATIFAHLSCAIGVTGSHFHAERTNANLTIIIQETRAFKLYHRMHADSPRKTVDGRR